MQKHRVCLNLCHVKLRKLSHVELVFSMQLSGWGGGRLLSPSRWVKVCSLPDSKNPMSRLMSHVSVNRDTSPQVSEECSPPSFARGQHFDCFSVILPDRIHLPLNHRSLWSAFLDTHHRTIAADTAHCIVHCTSILSGWINCCLSKNSTSFKLDHKCGFYISVCVRTKKKTRYKVGIFFSFGQARLTASPSLQSLC